MTDAHEAIERLRADLTIADAEKTPVEANRDDVWAVLDRIDAIEATWKLCAIVLKNINNPTVLQGIERQLEIAASDG